MVFYAIKKNGEYDVTEYYDITVNDWIANLTPGCLMYKHQVEKEYKKLKYEGQWIVFVMVEEVKDQPPGYF